MRPWLLIPILALMSVFVTAQSTSPDALYERGIDAITGVGTSRNDMLGIDYFRRSADLGYGPAQIALAYYYETGTVITGNQGQPSVDLTRKLPSKAIRSLPGLPDGATSSAMECRATQTQPANG